jgi:DNA phosphorothioation-associated putative methyltransferase
MVKQVVDDLYVHLEWCEGAFPVEHAKAVAAAQAQLAASCDAPPNVAKVNVRTGIVSLLLYPDFDTAPFPELAASWTFRAGPNSPPHFRRYDSTLNPPLLHRKELLVGTEHPHWGDWAAVTRTAEALGLFDDTHTIGFRLNWSRMIAAKGYRLQGNEFVPIGNDTTGTSEHTDDDGRPTIRRHLTAIVRTAISAPVQMLMRHGLLKQGRTFFDYGCGRGGDVEALAAAGIDAFGWDPHFAPDNPRRAADVINLGFVVNVIEDSAERVEAIRQAAALCKQVMAVAVMLHPAEASGVPYGDGVLTSRSTFQKYFSQAEFKDFLEQVLSRQAHMVAPGVAFVFADNEAEQRFISSRYRRGEMVERLLRAPRLPRTPSVTRAPRGRNPRVSAAETLLEACRPAMELYWRDALDLGRWPEAEEHSFADEAPEVLKARPGKLRALVEQQFDLGLLQAAAKARTDDLLVHFAALQFTKRQPYKQLEPRLQRDVKAFFGDYGSANLAAIALLSETSKPEVLLTACRVASESGFGYLDGEHSLQLHIDLVEQLPSVLRVYVDCGLRLWDATSEVQLVKIHIGSGKLTLLEYDDFEVSPMPMLKRRIKVNLRRLDYDIFEYGSPQYPKTVLLNKSRYLHEDQDGYAEQLAFDQELAAAGITDSSPSVRPEFITAALRRRRLEADGLRLIRSKRIPDLDDPCGANFSFRDFIECGETQRRLKLKNIPLRPETYNALHDLAVNLLDPLIDYFGPIKLTYGFCSSALAKNIPGRIAPALDQHASHELNARGNPICNRGGAACDFIVEDEDMGEVVDWIIANLPFDRLYFYGRANPVHLSYARISARKAYRFVNTRGGSAMPRPYTNKPPNDTHFHVR